MRDLKYVLDRYISFISVVCYVGRTGYSILILDLVM